MDSVPCKKVSIIDLTQRCGSIIHCRESVSISHRMEAERHPIQPSESPSQITIYNDFYLDCSTYRALTQAITAKKEKATPELAQFLWGTVKMIPIVLACRSWSAVRQKLTNHMNPQTPLTTASTSNNILLIWWGKHSVNAKHKIKSKDTTPSTPNH